MSSSINLPFFGGGGGSGGSGGIGPLSSNQILASILGGGAAGLLNQPTTTTSNFDQNSLTTGKSSTYRYLTPEQKALQGPLFDYINQVMSNPTAVVAPFAAAARDQTNATYNGLADTLRQQFMGNAGGGASGKFGDALVQGNLNRLGALQGVDTQFQEAAAQLPLQAEALGTNLLGMNFGSTSSGTSSTNSSGTSTSTQKKGSPLTSALGAGLGIAASFL